MSMTVTTTSADARKQQGYQAYHPLSHLLFFALLLVRYRTLLFFFITLPVVPPSLRRIPHEADIHSCGTNSLMRLLLLDEVLVLGFNKLTIQIPALSCFPQSAANLR